MGYQWDTESFNYFCGGRPANPIMANDDSNNVFSERIIITGVPKATKQKLVNIAANLGTTLSDFLKMKMPDIIKSYSENMHVPPMK